MAKKKTKKGVTKYDENRLKENMKVGMKGVDPSDIRPPRILLMQKSSDSTLFVDTSGKEAEVGQFFHTGKKKILDEFECYFVFAAKSKYVDQRKPEEGKKWQYKALGVMADDLSVFAMTFRSSALYTLGSLFSAVVAQKRPMYSFLCKIESKKLTSEKGEWFIPVCRVKELEEDAATLVMLEEQAKSYELRAEDISEDMTDEDLEEITRGIEEEKKEGKD